MRRARVLGLVGVVIVAALLAWWKLGGRDAGRSGTSAGSGQGSAATATTTSKRTPRVPLAKSTLAGRVVRASDGNAVAGATVALTPKLTIAGMMAAGGPSKGEAFDTTALTNDKGEFVFSDVQPMTYLVTATARGIGVGETEAVLPPGTRVDTVIVKLASDGVVLKGTVTDVLGGPIADARISVGKSRGMSMRATVSQLVTRTDAKGTYELALPPATYSVQASHDEYANEEESIDLVETATVDFTLTPGATIKGIVVTRDGTPVPEAKVSVGDAPAGFGKGSADADAKGEFVLRGLEPGALELVATGGDYSSTAPTVVEVGLGEQVDGVRIVVERGLLVAGRVVEKGTTTPVPGVLVGLFSMSGKSAMAKDATDDAGVFEIRGVRPASFLVFAIGDEAMPEIGKSVTVADKDVTDVLIEVERGVTVRGRVEPPMEATIRMSAPNVGFGDMFAMVKIAAVSATSDATTGEFTLEHVPSGSFTVHASTKAGMKGSAPAVVGKADVTGVVIKLDPRASVSGRVVDAKGSAVGDVKVVFSPATPDKASMTVRVMDGSFGGTSTRADGSFTVVGLDSGAYNVSVEDDHSPLAWAAPADKDKPTKPIELTIADREAKTGVVLTVEARDGTIKGIAIGPDGKPAADAWITPSSKRPPPAFLAERAAEKDAKDDKDNDGEEGDHEMASMYFQDLRPVLTNAEGRFTIERLRKGSYKLVGQLANGSARGELDDVKLGSNVTLKLARLGELSGVVTSGGAPVPAYEIVCDRKGSSERRDHVSDPKGAYKLERLPPGDYDCSVDANSGLGMGKVTIPAGEAKLDLALRPWSSVRGKVVSVLSGAPVAGVKVLATATSNKGTGFTRQIEDMLTGATPSTDANGAFVVSRVTPGEGELKFMPAAGGFTELADREYTVAEGQSVDLGTIKIIPPRDGDAGTLGMATKDVNAELVVETVADGGPAATAGIKPGDKIVAINGQPVAAITAELASKALASGTIGVGTRLTLAIDRAGTALQLAVTSVKW